MNSFWTQGRQGTGYLKHLLAQGRCWDLYLLKYPRGSHIPGHTDPVPGKKHHRINLVLWHAKKGGEFWRRGSPAKRQRLVFFRSDIEVHGINPVFAGSRWVLSFGFVS